MKSAAMILCTAMICATWCYSIYTRPGRYYFPKTWSNERAADTATGKIYCSEDDTAKNWLIANPVRGTLKEIIYNPFSESKQTAKKPWEEYQTAEQFDPDEYLNQKTNAPPALIWPKK